MTPPYESVTFKIVYLTPEQISHLSSQVELRLTELILSGENPNIIGMYQAIKMQLGKAK